MPILYHYKQFKDSGKLIEAGQNGNFFKSLFGFSPYKKINSMNQLKDNDLTKLKEVMKIGENGLSEYSMADIQAKSSMLGFGDSLTTELTALAKDADLTAKAATGKLSFAEALKDGTISTDELGDDFKSYDTEGGFDITYNDEKNFTTWAGLRWDLPSGTFKPGHTYEIGVEKYEDNSGDTNIAFRIYACESQYWFPKNNKITSVIYGDSRIGRIVTVPETATATTAFITFCNINSSCKNSNGDYLTSSVRGFYIYDVNEEDIIIRGEEPSNSYLQFCRVTEKKLAKDKKLIGNALYVTDEGNSFVTDFYGKSRKPLISEKIEFNNTGDKLQWKYKSEESWNDLLDIKSLKDEIKKEMMAGMVIVSDNSEDVEKEEL